MFYMQQSIFITFKLQFLINQDEIFLWDLKQQPYS